MKKGAVHMRSFRTRQEAREAIYDYIEGFYTQDVYEASWVDESGVVVRTSSRPVLSEYRLTISLLKCCHPRCNYSIEKCGGIIMKLDQDVIRNLLLELESQEYNSSLNENSYVNFLKEKSWQEAAYLHYTKIKWSNIYRIES